MSKLSKILAKNMKLRRDELGYNQHDLATKSGYSKTNIAKIETGTTWVSGVGLAKIAAALQCDESDLFLDRDKVHKPSLKEALGVIELALSAVKSIPPELLEIISTWDFSNPVIKETIHSMSKGFSKKETQNSKKLG
jgi:transcriptional regulator with XRE-family HTH domain